MTYLHELVVTLAAPWVVLSPRSGQLTGTGAEGVFVADHRILSVARLSVGGEAPVPVHLDEYDGGSVRYDAVVPGLGDPGHDLTVTVGRDRELSVKGMRESIEVVNRSTEEIEYDLIVALGTDLAGTAMVRSGAAAELALCPVETDGNTLTWRGDGVEVTVTLDPAPAVLIVLPDGVTEARWQCRTPVGESTTIGYHVGLTVEPGEGFAIAPPASRPTYNGQPDGVSVECDDSRVGRWVERSLDDVAGLMLSAGEDRYLGAGPPWYLTLFGRDSLISASMLVAVDPGLAAGTLRVLARWQGSRHDADAAEQPGKIPHELREAVADHGSGLVLPAAYYGTHDATPLWITTLHKAWRWGMPAAEVEALLPTVEKALAWIRDEADPDGDGFLEYIDTSGHGLANQGWKDSVDAVQWPDGTLAEAPIALSEVQAYAYAAALAGADLLTAFAEPAEERPGDEWRDWAASLKERFREAFWVEGYPAIALDAHKRPVAGAASNMGHLLGTGLLDPHEEAAVAHRLSQPDLDSGYGLRTLSNNATRFNPLGYHTGSVWPHDTAIAITGLYAAANTNASTETPTAAGYADVARSFVTGLTKAAESFGYRLPELYDGLGGERTPTPYPLACRPQAWAAASAIAVVVAALGIEPDVPAGVLRITPADPFPWRRLELHGLRIGDERLSLRVDDGQLTILAAPEGLTIQT
ncbi:amylo-alpha-16-glucosidase [Kribbella sp. NBC_01245]|uniref:glycogen debranching N-terminal domain-containing protein n=1 Tax=Kribbella sp. NBC_01245 TaxID=2903578 RepID=UPI002E2ADCFF|nr:glycogen debranching N-terminal domain-containing protein [Kribbella sp. NBC_01245]